MIVDESFDPDSALIERIATGNQSAVQELVGRHIGPLTSLARRMLGSQEDAEEVVQEVFLRAWTHAAVWKPGRARFSTWMHRVAINQCYDRLRRRREHLSGNIPERIDEAPDPEECSIFGDISMAVDSALQSLPDRQRAALVLFHYQGHTQVETAEVLAVSVESVESLLARGRRTLRKRLKGLAYEHEIGNRQIGATDADNGEDPI